MLASGAVPSLAERIARKAFRPLYRPYYRLLWGRRFPGAAGVERLVRRYERSSLRADVPLADIEWDAQYADGWWDFLAGEGEVERFRAVAELIERYAPPRPGVEGRDELGEVLDVGCGEGLLAGSIDPLRPYLGIDLSAEAIARAEERFEDPAVTGGPLAAAFEVADAETWQPDRRFAAVILNECLYYFRRPLEGARRYLDAVEPPAGGKPGGVMIVSMFRGPRAEAIGRRLAAELPLAEQIELARGEKRWRIAVFRPTTAPPPAR